MATRSTRDSGGPLTQRTLESLDCLSLTFGNYFHASVSQIPNEPAHAVAPCDVISKKTESRHPERDR